MEKANKEIKQNQKKKSLSNDITKVIGILIAFSMLCFITSCFMNMNADSVIKENIPITGGEIGPIEVSKDYSVYNVHVEKYISNNSWSFVGGDVLDQDKNYLFGFGKELWKESGFDSDGSWTEQDTDLNIKITFNKAGFYFLRFNSESDTANPMMNNPDFQSDTLSDMQVTVSPKRGSSLIHFILGCISLIIGVGLFVFVHLTTKEASYNTNRWRIDRYDF